MRNVGRWMILGLVAGGCVEQPPSRRGNQGVSQQEVDAVRRRVASNTAPTPTHRLDFNYGNKVTLLGYDIQPEEVRPGSNVTVTWYWHCDATTGDGWRLYTHLDDTNGPRQNHDNDGDVRRAYQPERWRQGEYITDRQTFEIPADWESPVVKVNVGLWRNDERMRVVRGTADREGRALAITLNTGVQARVSELDVPHASGAIVVDGQLNEPAWRTAGSTGPLVNAGTGAPAGATDAHGGVRVLWDEQNLYLGWEVSDDNLIETGADRDLHYWENDTTEVMIDPDGNGRDYYEIQASPGGHTFDSQQPQPPSANNFGNLAWNPPLQVAAVRNGTLGNEADVDTGYTVELAIPFASINAGAPHTPPAVGDTWRINFFLMDKPKQGGVRSAAWSPPRNGNFHSMERFGRITFRAASAIPALIPVPPPGAPGVPGAVPTIGVVPPAPGAAAPAPAPAPAPAAAAPANAPPAGAAPAVRPALPPSVRNNPQIVAPH